MDVRKPNLTLTEVQERLHRGLLLEYVSIGWMSVEGTASVLAGVLAGSLALLAFGGDSFIELLSAYAVANYLRRPERGKADSEILKRTERITRALLVILIPTIGLGVVYSYITGVRAETSIFGMVVAIGAALIMPGLWLGKKRIGEETNCLPLSIDAIESATCFLMSIALLGGLLGVYLFGLWWVDYLATGIILVFVAKEALEGSGNPTTSRNKDSGPHLTRMSNSDPLVRFGIVLTMVGGGAVVVGLLAYVGNATNGTGTSGVADYTGGIVVVGLIVAIIGGLLIVLGRRDE